MLIPWKTNAPIYYFPWVTIALIVVNTFVFFREPEDLDDIRQWMLQFGEGLHPAQWLTNNFLHADFMHLFSNMIFLWSFGLVVEGKLGWKLFLPLYLVMGTLYGLILQIGMLGAESGAALGASGVIFALLAIAMIWAPRNEFSCIVLIGRGAMFDISILFFAVLYIVLQFVEAYFTSFRMSTPVLHLTGVVVGGVAGVALLKTGLVDCEGWDLFTVIRGKEGEVALPERKEKKPAELPPDRLAEGLEQLRLYLRNGSATAALALDADLTRLSTQWKMPETELLKLIQLMHRDKQWGASIPLMVQHLKRFPERSAATRLMLARILVVDQNRPYKALEVLGKIPAGALSPEQTELRRKIETEAERRKVNAELEMADEDW